jgi:hypothetical protein
MRPTSRSTIGGLPPHPVETPAIGLKARSPFDGARGLRVGTQAHGTFGTVWCLWLQRSDHTPMIARATIAVKWGLKPLKRFTCGAHIA